ncbi:cyclohexanecarboxylate-CoA ligase [Paracoccus pantotrophus]|uniref:Cyclohexanecarboxylate-CoA ligase n=1 Tax=Paracoccus pantotrophus TaxID=82367 RepID=A0A1I5FK86_PARPN|nr:cyclohexanecarboxylate-CoA ligase [Paracoccus pantotrophus]MDF3853610.1 cyclohexanecarboxylate-CoA ligase [Paracoccus pantotrophus]QFG35897.1 cyclohexanecarboxylate-CoA ligase [Paracoccus pantotrophus]QLH12773.1 cyclohexanecarboxylate-CoA ligase [Paracoccus pantotrophus]RDD97307.1 cyclohexanecarboxylate-CoA ligase [Paracoccus pantotrophus]RKS43841.1 cyclohexanecarboxylate-CoA ligase [Paracoccus pantotrophus]
MKFDAVLIEPRRARMEAEGLWPGKTLLDYFEDCLREKPQAVALTSIVTATGDRRDLTWTELDALSWRVAAGLRRLGLGRDDVLACQLSNSWELVALYIGCRKLGVVFNPVMPIFREHELLFMLKHGEAKAFVVPKLFRGFDHETMAESMRPDLPDLRHVIVAGGDGPNSFDALLLDPALEVGADLRAVSARDRGDANDVCQLIYTSGTTGEPKGVMHTANTMYSNLVAYADRLHLGADDTVLMFSPMAHQTGFMYGFLMPVMLCARMILMDSWDKDLAARLIQDERVSFTMASTPFLMDLTSAVEEGATDPSSLRIFLCAGTAIPGPLVERAQRILDAKVISAWGMTENGAVTVVAPEDPDERSVQTDGFALPGMELQIRDPDGMPLGPGQEGELFVRGCSNFAGYLKRPQWNATDAEGWFDTGDIARMDEQGYIRICGRSKDVIIRGAENIPVVEVEALLYKHPAVQQVAIVAYPDERLGERACAFIVPKPGQSIDLPAMVNFLSGLHLAKQYFPERLEIRDRLPSTASGKIQKFALRNELRAEYEAMKK